MAKAENEKTPAGTKSLYVPVPLLVLVSLLIFFTYDYGQTASQLPLLVSTVTLVLIILDFLSRLRGKIGTFIRMSLGAGFHDLEMKHDPEWRSEIVQVIWVAFCVISIVLIGILPTIPIFVFLYMVTQGKQTIVSSMMVSIFSVVVVALVFEVLLEYDLYRGLLFDQDSY